MEEEDEQGVEGSLVRKSARRPNIIVDARLKDERTAPIFVLHSAATHTIH